MMMMMILMMMMMLMMMMIMMMMTPSPRTWPSCWAPPPPTPRSRWWRLSSSRYSWPTSPCLGREQEDGGDDGVGHDSDVDHLMMILVMMIFTC